jgi:hypothetical protein
MDDTKEEEGYSDMLRYTNKAFLKVLRRYLDQV